MNIKIRGIVLSDDLYFAQGIIMLLPEFEILHLRFMDVDFIHQNVDCDTSNILLIDSRIMTSMTLSMYPRFYKLINASCVIWLAHPVTGGVWPAGTNVNFFIAQKKSICTLRANIVNVFKGTPCSFYNVMSEPKLTSMERKLLPFFSLGTNVSILSSLFGVTTTTVYIHRGNITKKMGFSSPERMCAFFFSNRDLLDHYRKK